MKTLWLFLMVAISFAFSPYQAKSQVGSLLWGTYYGGEVIYSAYVAGAATDRSGNVYITGSAPLDTLIPTKGAYQVRYGGGSSDAILAKFSPSGILLWATYYGGSGDDYGYNITIDTSDNIYITGYTTSDSGLATKGAYMVSFSGTYDYAFLAKFSPAGGLLWATYYGGDNGAAGYDIATDIRGNVYITGQTSSDSDIATVGAYQASYGGVADGFLAKFNHSGSLLWSTYFGGSGLDNGISITTDTIGSVYIAGTTYSTTGIATSGAYQTSGGKPNNNYFLAKFDTSGGLSWATYYGGTTTYPHIAADLMGNIYLTGNTDNASGIATSGSYQTTYYDYSDAFLSKFNTSGNLIWATYFGGKFNEGEDIATDKSGDIYFTGYAQNTSIVPVTSGAYRSSYGGANDAYLAKFSSKGSLIYSSFIPGQGNTYIACDAFGNFYITGHCDSNGIGTPGAYQDSTNMFGSPFLAKLRIKTFNNDAGILSIINPKDSFCGNLLPVSVRLTNYGLNTLTSVTVNLKINSKLQTPYNWTGSIMTDSSMPVNIGNYYFPSGIDSVVAFTSQPNGFADSVLYNDTSKSIDTVITGPSTIIGSNTSVCYRDTASIGGTAISGTTYSWASKPIGFTSKKATARVAPTVTTSYILTQTLTSTGCIRNDTEIVTVNPLPDAFFSHKLMADSVKFSPVYSTYSNYYWAFGDGDSSNQINPIHAYVKNGIYTVRLTATDKNGCTSTYQTNDTINYTGIKTLTANSCISIYPNPATSTLNIESTTNPIQSITIYDATGRVVGVQNLEPNPLNLKVIDVSKLPSGIYIVKLGTNVGSYTAKFVKE